MVRHTSVAWALMLILGLLASSCGATAAPPRETPGESPAGSGAGSSQDEDCPLGCFLSNGACLKVVGQDAPPPANQPIGAAETRNCPTRCCPRQVAGPDQDGDGIGDRADRCPSQPEDRDGFEDADGCADPDNDQDGVVDVDDMCPNVAGNSPSGCPK